MPATSSRFWSIVRGDCWTVTMGTWSSLSACGRAARRSVEGAGVPFVYLLRCVDDSLSCGWTTDVEQRLRAHRAKRLTRADKLRLVGGDAAPTRASRPP